METLIRRVVAALILGSCATVALANTTAPDDSHEYEIISRQVVVQENDTLTLISQRELGKAGYASMLANYNKLPYDAPLVAGSYINIPIQVPPRGEFAEVVFVKGTVTATRRIYGSPQASLSNTTAVANSIGNVVNVAAGVETEVVTLTRNAPVFSGDLITTSSDGYVSVVFSSGSVINLQPDTITSLDRLICLETDNTCQIEINTQQGEVTSSVESRDQQPVDFRIITPYASAAVRGTVFDVSASENLLVGVIEGLVDVTAQNENVPVNAGFGVSVREGESPSEPIELIPGPVFRRVPARFTEGDTLEWWSFNDASSYAAMLSNDEAATEVLTDFEVPGNNAVLDVAKTLDNSIEPGDYFITIRAIDRQGLKGFASNTRITLASIDASIDPVNTVVAQQGGEFLITVEDGPVNALGYEIQISRDEEFSDPLSVDVNQNGTAVFRIDEDQVFSRARVLLDPYTVSAFGQPSSN